MKLNEGREKKEWKKAGRKRRRAAGSRARLGLAG